MSLVSLIAGALVVLGVFGGVFMLTGAKSTPVEDPSLATSAESEWEDEYGDTPLALQGTKKSSFDFRDSLQQSVGKRFEKSSRGAKLVEQLQKADLKLHPTEWTAMVSAASIVLGLLLMLRFKSIIGLIIGFAVGFFGSRIYLKMRYNKRRKKFEDQLGPTVLALSNGVKAGYTLAQAMNLVSQNAAPPMGPDMARVMRETQLGVPFIEAFGHMVDRSESEDLKLLMTAIQIQQQVGGNLAVILDNIEYTIRERVRIKGEIKTITGQARASGWVLIVLPLALSGILYMIAPSYFDPMLTKLPGQIMLGFAFFMIAGGYAIIRKIVNVEV